jgi:hypothetical protein
MGGRYMNELHYKIQKAVKKIAQETVKTNIAGRGQSPIILSENDMCCYLFKELYNPKKYSINTEITEAPYRHDMVIYDLKNSDYSLRESGKWKNCPKYWKCKHYLAIIELTYIWSGRQKSIRKKIKDDLNVLSDRENKSDLRYLIVFDMRGQLRKSILKEIKTGYRKYKGIYLMYSNIKSNEFFVV